MRDLLPEVVPDFYAEKEHRVADPDDEGDMCPCLVIWRDGGQLSQIRLHVEDNPDLIATVVTCIRALAPDAVALVMDAFFWCEQVDSGWIDRPAADEAPLPVESLREAFESGDSRVDQGVTVLVMHRDGRLEASTRPYTVTGDQLVWREVVTYPDVDNFFGSFVSQVNYAYLEDSLITHIEADHPDFISEAVPVEDRQELIDVLLYAAVSHMGHLVLLDRESRLGIQLQEFARRHAHDFTKKFPMGDDKRSMAEILRDQHRFN